MSDPKEAAKAYNYKIIKEAMKESADWKFFYDAFTELDAWEKVGPHRQYKILGPTNSRSIPQRGTVSLMWHPAFNDRGIIETHDGTPPTIAKAIRQALQAFKEQT